MDYGYLGASWGANANAGRQNAQNQTQMYQQYMPQQRQLQLGKRQFQVQKAQNAMQNKDRMFGFGINALTGLMR